MKLINLVKNELIKIFHKPGIYVVFLITVGLSILSVVLNKYLTIDTINGIQVSVEVDINDYNKEDPIEMENYVADQSQYEFEKVTDKYKYSSPEYYYLDSRLYDVIYCINRSKYVEKNEKQQHECESEYEILIANADNFDYKKILAEEKAELVKELERIGENANQNDIDFVKNQMLVLDYRVDNDFPKTYSASSIELDNYPSLYREYYSMDQNDKNYNNKNDLILKKEKEKEFFETKYKIEHNMYKTDYNNNLRSNVLYKVQSTDLMVLVAIILITGSIVAEEFNKGTIKQLLVRPYKRSQILTSKLIAALITFFLFFVAYMIVDAIIVGIGLGGFKELLDPVISYNFNKGIVEEHNILIYCLLSFLAILPKYLIIMSFVFMVSVIFTSTSVSMASGYFLMIAASIISSFTSVKAVNYLPFTCWDFTDYLFGGISHNPYGGLYSSLIVVLITLIGINLISYIIFSKKNIKNQ